MNHPHDDDCGACVRELSVPHGDHLRRERSKFVCVGDKENKIRRKIYKLKKLSKKREMRWEVGERAQSNVCLEDSFV